MQDLKQIILRWVSVTPQGCWEWRRSLFKTGYGAVNVGGKMRTAHRVAYETFVGPIPKGMFVCHHCDNRSCCNPNHLFLGTPQDNVDDMMRKGRYRTPISSPGERNGNSRLTNEKVLEIRSLVRVGISQREVARMFGVSPSTVHLVAHRKVWRHI